MPVKKVSFFKKSSLTVTFSVAAVTVFASDYGTKGLIDIPTSRMRADGAFTTTIALDERAQSYAITYQAFPWLESTFRYTGIYQETGTGRFGDFYTWDRNYEVKARLLEETLLLPEVAIGIRDAVGTGVFSAEYLTGSKQIGDFDVSLGLGWGRLAGKGDFTNPTTWLGDSFKTRDQNTGEGGKLSTSAFFRGEEVGIFGGVEYQAPGTPLKLQLEYNPDQYSYESRAGFSAPSSPISIGAEWEISPNYSIAASFQHGDAFGLRFHAYLDSTEKPARSKPAAIRLEKKNTIAGLDLPDWYEPLVDASLATGVNIQSARVIPETQRAEIALKRGGYAYWPDAIEDAHIQANLALPDDVNTVDYIVEEAGLKLHTVRLPRLGKNSFGFDEVNFSKDAILMPSRDSDQAIERLDVYENDLKVTFEVDGNIHLFDPDNPFALQEFVRIGTNWEFAKGWHLKGAYQFGFYDNLDKNTRSSDSVLPHVRSDAALYLKESDGSGVANLLLEKRGSATPELHYRAFAGVLEQMYSGVGGEVLFQPYGSRIATGLSAAYAKQRDYDGGLGHLDYEVLTGHASLYWATPWYNYDVAMHLGRYLAKDVGGTLEVRRTFDNGWMVGLWGTLTDVPFNEFGEGSFDKGIFLQIPLGHALTGGVDSKFKMNIRSIQRDGGARLDGYSGQLWWDARAARSDVFLEAE